MGDIQILVLWVVGLHTRILGSMKILAIHTDVYPLALVELPEKDWWPLVALPNHHIEGSVGGAGRS
jgi:hypothetical protein